MAEKKSGLGKALLLGAAVAVAGGIVSYLKREQLKKLADEVAAKIKAGEEEPEEEAPVEEEPEDEAVDIIIESEEEPGDEEKDADVVIEISIEKDEEQDKEEAAPGEDEGSEE